MAKEVLETTPELAVLLCDEEVDKVADLCQAVFLLGLVRSNQLEFKPFLALGDAL